MNTGEEAGGDVEVVTELPEGAVVEDETVSSDQESEDIEAIARAMAADKAAGDTEPGAEPAPAAPATEVDKKAARLEKAKASEERRIERQRARTGVEEASSLVARARATAESLAAREARIARLEKEKEDEVQRFRGALKEGGLGALGALGLDYSQLTAEELERQDPQALSRQALAEAKRLREELAEERRVAAAAAQARRIEEARAADNLELVEFAESETGKKLSPTVAKLATAARTSRMAANLLFSTADQVLTVYQRQLGRGPTFDELVNELDRGMDFLKTYGEGTGQAPAPDASQAPRHAHQRTLGSPRTGDRVAPRRELTEEELHAQQEKELQAAIDADIRSSR